MDEIPEYKIRLLDNVVTFMGECQEGVIRHLKQDRFLAEADWDLVKQITSIRSPYAHKERPATALQQKLKEFSKVHDELEQPREEARQRILQVEKVSYWRQFGKGLLSHRAINCLSDIVDELSEKQGARLEVEQLKNTWSVGSLLGQLQQFCQHISERYSSASAELDVVQWPKHAWHRALLLSCRSLKAEALVFLLCGLNLLLTCFQLVHIITDRNDQATQIIKSVIYAVLLAHILLKLALTPTTFFKRAENIFDFCFGILYILCIISTVLKLRRANPMVYFGLEFAAALRLLRILFIIPRVMPYILRLLNYRINENAGLAYDTVKGFIIGEEDCNKHIKRMIDHPKIVEETLRSCRTRRLDAMRHLAMLQIQQPGAAVSVKTKQAARFCLNSMQDTLNEMRDAGIVDEKEYEHLDHVIQEHKLQVQGIPPSIAPPSLEKQLEHLPWVGNNRELLNEIVAHAERREYKEGDIVIRQGDQSDGMYILASGIMKVEVRRKEDVILEEYMYSGRYFGEIGTITGDRRSATVVASVPSVTYFIKKDQVKHIVKKYEDLYHQFVISYCISKTSDVLQEHPTFLGWTDVKLKTHLANGELIELGDVKRYRKRIDGEFVMLIRGSAEGEHTKRLYEARDGDCVLIPNHVNTVSQYESEPGWLFSVPPVNFQFQSFMMPDDSDKANKSNTSLQSLIRKAKRRESQDVGAPKGMYMFAALAQKALYTDFSDTKSGTAQTIIPNDTGAEGNVTGGLTLFSLSKRLREGGLMASEALNGSLKSLPNTPSPAPPRLHSAARHLPVNPLPNVVEEEDMANENEEEKVMRL